MALFADYELRRIEEADLALLLEWRNSERVHSMMLTDHRISWEEHRRWFERTVQPAAVPINFIFQYRGQPLGYVGYTAVDDHNKICSPGAYLGAAANETADAGIILMYMGMDYAFSSLGMHKICTEVFTDNKKAYRVNRFLGYREEGLLRKHFLKNGRYVDAYLLGMLREEWMEKKQEISRNYLIKKTARSMCDDKGRIFKQNDGDPGCGNGGISGRSVSGF